MNQTQTTTGVEETELRCAATLLIDDVLISSVLDSVGIEEKDRFRRRLVRGIFKKESEKLMVMTAWAGIEKFGHQEHWKSFKDSMRRAHPEMDLDTLLLTFASLYTDITEKIFDELENFVGLFVARAKEVYR